MASRAFWFRLALLVALAVLVTACVPAIIADPCNPAWDSQQVTGAYQAQGDLSLALVFGCAAVLGGLIMWLFAGLGGRR